MNKRNSHTAKTRDARDAYSRYIRKLDYEPTVEEPAPFSPSNESGEELAEPTSSQKRKMSIINAIKDHFSENWVNWLVSGAIIILIFLMIDSKVDLAKISTSIDNAKESISTLISDSKELRENAHGQALVLKEHEMQIIQLEKESERNRGK